MTTSTAGWDVFISYAWRDVARVRPLAANLARHGLRVFRDEHGVRDFRSLSRTINTELGRAKTLLAYYSAAYPTRPACQWELTAAYLAGQQEGDPRRRVLVVNPEPTSVHIHPIELRDTLGWVGATPDALTEHARQVAGHVAALTGPIGFVHTAPPPRWLPAPHPTSVRGPATRTTRVDLMWRLHSALQPEAAPLVTDRPYAGVAILRGLGGTALAEQYAVRFGAAFPGGIYWLKVSGDADPVQAYAAQVKRICAALDLRSSPDDTATNLSRLAVAFDRNPHPRLWVVEGVPGDLDERAFTLFTAPHPTIATLVTTRSGNYQRFGEQTDLVGADH